VYATAYLNLKIVGEIQKGETFFINGGEGGLGIATIQLAKHVFGAKVVAQVASDENGEFCKGVGADVVSNRFKDDLVATLAANPPNVAIDPVGGPLMGKCIATMPYRGRWISLASMAGNETTLDVNLLWRKNLRVIGSTLRSRTSAEKAQILDGLVRDVWPAFESGRFAPFIHKVLPVAEAAQAGDFVHMGGDGACLHLAQPADKAQVFRHRHLVIQGRLLRQEADLPLAGRRLPHHALFADKNVPVLRRKAAGQQAQQRGFSRAVPAQQANGFSLFNPEGNVPQRRQASVFLGQVFRPDHRAPSFRSLFPTAAPRSRRR
jgi:hypothetical protein